MSQNEANSGEGGFNRRDFIKNAASFSSLMLLMGGVPLQAQEAKPQQTETNFHPEDHRPVTVGVIGCGSRGREIIQTLSLMVNSDKTPNAPVVAVCDVYPGYMRKAKEFVPNAQTYDDYKKLLEQKDIETVIVATPTHLHREIVEAALKAGKHVYCEAPIAHTVEDARAIAKAAKAANKLNFQAGLQMRSDPGKEFVLRFIHTGAVGTPVMARSQWHRRTSWRKPGSTPERDKALNWRLDSTTSCGLAGEIGVHHFDLMTWMLGKRPSAITGFGAILDPDLQQDGRDVADTIQTIMQYPGKVNSMFDCTLANSFDGEYDMLYGTGAAIMFRGEIFGDQYTPAKSWLFEEANSQLFGWEIYAAKEQFYKETGITLSAGASHSVHAKGEVPASPYLQSTLHYALEAFLHNSLLTSTIIKNFTETYGDDAEGLTEELKKPENAKGRHPAAGYVEGLEATIIGIKANEAVVKTTKVELPNELFEV